MMHEYAKEVKEDQSRGPQSNNNHFTVKKFRTMKEVVECIEHYQAETVTHFVKYNRDKQFGDEDYVPNIEGGRIHYWSHTGKCDAPIPYDGVPFMHVGRWALMCHQGYDINKRQKEKYQMRKQIEQQESGVVSKSRTRAQVTKKVNCPAEIYVVHIMKFPQFKVPKALLAVNSLPTTHMRKHYKKKMIESFARNPKRFIRQSWYYVRLPDPMSHEGHPVMSWKMQNDGAAPSSSTEGTNDVANPPVVFKRKKQSRNSKYRTKEPVDPRVLQKMYELTRQGVSSVKMMQEAVAEYVRDELFPFSEPPPSIYRRYNPTSNDIQNAMYKVKQEMRLEGKSVLQYRCAALVREITELVVQTDSEVYLNQLEDQLRNIYNSIKNNVPIQQVISFKTPEDKGSNFLSEEPLEVTFSSEGEVRAKRPRTRKQMDHQAELDSATYHLKLENRHLQAADNQMELDGVLEHHQVHEIIEQEDGTVTEVYYYQPIDQSDQYVEQDVPVQQDILLQPLDSIKSESEPQSILLQPQVIKSEPHFEEL